MAKINGNDFITGWSGAGLEILAVGQSPGTTGLTDRLYRIRYDCCGTEADIKYESLTRRIYKHAHGEASRCQACVRGDKNARAAATRRAAQTRKAQGSKFLHLRPAAFRLHEKGQPNSMIEDLLDLPAETMARWVRESDQPMPSVAERYRISDPARVLALSGAWR
jgi:hypothetical protein